MYIQKQQSEIKKSMNTTIKLNKLLLFCYIITFVTGNNINVNIDNINVNNFIDGETNPSLFASLLANLGYTSNNLPQIAQTPYNLKMDGMIQTYYVTNENDRFFNHLKFFDFLVNYPCDDKLRDSFRNSVNSYIGKSKWEAVKPYINEHPYKNGAIVASFISHTYNCHLSENTYFGGSYDSSKRNRYMCQYNNKLGGECYLFESACNNYKDRVIELIIDVYGGGQGTDIQSTYNGLGCYDSWNMIVNKYIVTITNKQIY